MSTCTCGSEHLDTHLGAIEQADRRSNGHGAYAVEQGDFDDDPQR